MMIPERDIDTNDLQEDQKEEYNLSECIKDENTSNTTVRSTLAQIIAVLVINTAPFSLGMMIAYPTLAIGEIREGTEELQLNDEQASWFGSLLFLVEPGSNILGSLIQPHIGRKFGMILAFIPQFISWLSIPLFTSVSILYSSAILNGISVGSLTVPVFAYYGEITEPRTRGILTGSYYVTICSGMLIEFLLGSILHWKFTAAVNTIVPIIGIISLACKILSFGCDLRDQVTLEQIPDSPVWLLEKGKKEDAHRALAWFRGWVTKDMVNVEFQEINDYIERSKNSEESHGDIIMAENSKTSIILKQLEKNISLIFRPAMMKPLILSSVCHLAYHSASLNAMRSYFIEILTELHVPINPKWLVFINSFVTICGGIICMSTVKFLGKRRLFLISLTACSTICLILAGYTFYSDGVDFVWIPAAMICLLHLFMSAGIDPVPWMLASEVFPVRGRSIGVGLTLAFYCTIGFVFSKTFYKLKSVFHLTGCFLLYGTTGFVCLFYLFYNLIETEGKTLADVEAYFSGNSKKLKAID